MSEINYQALRDALKNINIEQWSTRFNGDGYEVGVKGSGHCFFITVAQEVADKNTAKFISAASPETIKALLDELEDKDKDKRIAGLESRAVNLPKRSVGEVMHMSGFSRDYAEGWCAGNDNAIHEIRAAGIGVKGE
ncbi:ead/Ea22-like family protein [Citrobacter braakii]|uniref:ead/Ea22-like family protein n=1 Tax=Citrobacter braakii TaxID=57706 RepID=UPI002B249F22|nr:ead/Ea22-like family protein [Citrobacter braakii]MEB0966138.1 ead/Ea22-like family protein [Citrobacter braakii]